MDLALALKIIGWALVAVPVALYLFVSFIVIRGAARDDAMVMGLVMIGFAFFGIGVGTLLLVYLTNIGAQIVK